MNRKQARLVHVRITVNHPALQPYYNHLKDSFLAITEEALGAKSISLIVVNI